ncbi:uncharacterized protein N7496_011031 [Penicillium cataractarum]|uniref:Uncharacterized protein n=1 Tax=Penicillium cataractarum TaxID=2100454 RepID=A0A9W9RJD5_9EURO|nr:uncharacterized protein N7496_011031 [Penicillium cataractarum]KAJ5358618.1 hypothetical protein N7496_011031 [Penicillium cataractarum]
MAEASKDNQDEPVENIIVAADNGRLDLVTKLLEGGADPNTVDEIGNSALHNAAKKGHWHIARLLLEKNASPRIQNGHDAIPLHLAIRGGHKQIVRLLLECDPSTCRFKENGRWEPVAVAAILGHAEIAQNLLDCGATTFGEPDFDTPLHSAARKGYHDVCDVLLKHDKGLNRTLWEKITGPSLPVDSKDYAGDTPFAFAVEKGHERCVEVFLSHYPELVKSRNGQKTLLFHRAIEMKNIEMVRMFLNHGVDLEMKGSYGYRALHKAVTSKNMELIQLILDHGAIIDAKDSNGYPPASATGDPKIRMLLRNHANANTKGPSSSVAPTASAPPPEYQA